MTETLDQMLKTVEDQFPPSTPVLMLNLLRYRDVAPDGSKSGREVYFDNYLPAFRQVVQALGVSGVEVSLVGKVQAALLAPPEEVIHEIAVVRYPSFAAFRQIAASAEYAEYAEPLRNAALADLRLYATSPVDL